MAYSSDLPGGSLSTSTSISPDACPDSTHAYALFGPVTSKQTITFKLAGGISTPHYKVKLYAFIMFMDYTSQGEVVKITLKQTGGVKEQTRGGGWGSSVKSERICKNYWPRDYGRHFEDEF